MGGLLADLEVSRWVTTQADRRTHCATTGRLEPVSGLTNADDQGTLNLGRIRNFLPGHVGIGGVIEVSRFGELALNLTAVLRRIGVEACSGREYVSTWAYSQDAALLGSEMRDYVAPEAFPVTDCKRTPRMSSTASADTEVGGSVFDTAHLAGGFQPTGKLTFQLYGPDDRGCSGEPVFTSEATVDGTGNYRSAPFTPDRAGTYRWRVEYSGDAYNHGVGPTACITHAETVVVEKARPLIRTMAVLGDVSANPLRAPMHDAALFAASGTPPQGTITFEVFGPDDATCASPRLTVTFRVHGNFYRTPTFIATTAGDYRWTARYSGDSDHAPATTSCDDLSEQVHVRAPVTPRIPPSLTTTASHDAPAGSPISDTAHLTGATDPTGDIEFSVYGPDDPTCTGAPAASPSIVAVTGSGNYHSASFTPTVAGTYRWVAHYSGDEATEAVDTSCDDAGETVVVSKARPELTTVVASTHVPNSSGVRDTAHLTHGADPQGTITFRLYGPDDAHCTRSPAFTVTQHVDGNGSYGSPMPAPTIAGTYRWTATYSGDANNDAVAAHCDDPHETVVVAQPPPVPINPNVPTPGHSPTPTPKPGPTPTPRPKPSPTPRHKPSPTPGRKPNPTRPVHRHTHPPRPTAKPPPPRVTG